MLTKTQAFIDAEEEGKIPQFFVYISTDLARRGFTVKGTETSTTGTGYYDGSRYVGDGGTFGAELGTVQIRPLLLSLPIINKTVTQGMRGLLTALSAAQVGHCYVELDNLYRTEDDKFFFSELLTGPVAEDWLNGAFEYRMGFPGLDYNDQLSLFRGKNIDALLKGPVFAVSADAVSETIHDKWEVPRSSLYSTPAQQNQPIPLVLGDMTVNSGIDEDGDGTADTGPIPLVCIDTDNDVWALACHPLLTVANGQSISLYDDDGLISSGDYTYTASNDYESVGITIAYVTFSTPPTGTVTGKYKGAPADDGTLIENPIECVEKMLSLMGEAATFEDTSFETAKNGADDESYTCAGVIMADNPKAYWLGKILSNFIGSWFIDENDEIVVYLDTAGSNYMNVVGNLKESMVKGHLRLSLSVDNLVTRPVINYAVSYAKIDRRFKTNANASYLETYSDTTLDNDVAVPLYFDFVRDSTTITAVASRLDDLYGTGLKVYRGVRTTDFSLVNWEPGDFFSFDTIWQYDDDGNEITGAVGRVLNLTIDPKNLELILDFYDTDNYLLAEPSLYDGSRYVGDGLSFGGERAA